MVTGSTLWSLSKEDYTCVINQTIYHMNLTKSIKNSAPKLAEGNEQYLKSIIDVNGYVYEVTTSEMPALLKPPKNWDEFLTTFVQIKSSTMLWVNTVLIGLVNVPKSIQASSEHIEELFEKAEKYAQLLEKQYDPDLAEALLLKLLLISEELGSIKSLIENVMTKIDEFDSSLPETVEDFVELVRGFEQTTEHDRQQVEEYKVLISELQHEIALLWGRIGLSTAGGTGIVILCKLAKKIRNKWIRKISRFIGYGLAFGLLQDVLNSIYKIIAKNGEINILTQEMDAYTADIAQLIPITQQFEGLKNYVGVVQDNLAYIYEQWDNMSVQIAQGIEDIQNANENVDKHAFIEALQDICSARVEWHSVYEDSKDLTIELQVNTAEIEMEMLPAEDEPKAMQDEKIALIEKKIAEGKVYSAIDYYNLIA